jgi:PAS domain S-box-containing protein
MDYHGRMASRPAVLVALLCLTATAGGADAQFEFRFESVTVDDGLSQGGVSCALQDSDGFMPLGTDDPASIRYESRLTGVSDDWHDVGDVGVARLWGLAPGDYTLAIKAANLDGGWSETASSFPFKIAATFWSTAWFRVLIVIFLGGLALVAHRLRTRFIQRHAAELDELNKRLTESEELHRRILEDQTELILRWKPDGTCMFANDAYCRYFGVSHQEALAINIYDFAPVRYVDLAKDLVGGLSPQTPAFSVETDLERVGGVPAWQSWQTRGLFDDDGNLVEIQTVGSDVTERRRAEIERERVEKALRMSQHSLDASANMIFWLRSDYSFSYVNDASCGALGYTRDELLQMSVPDIDPIFTREKWEREGWWERFRRAGSMTFQTVLRRKDGSTFPVENTANFVTFEGEDYLFAFLIDITERKRAETQLRDLAIELSAAEERERRKVATYLHDQIGQTLAVLRMRLGELAEAPDAERKAAIQDIRGLLDEALDDTRAATFDLSPPILYELGLGPAVEWAVDRICAEHGLEFEFEEEGDGTIEPDTAAQLFRAARELLMNVVKHAQARRVWVEVDVETRAGVRIAVRDDGVGFDATKTLSNPREAGYGLLSIRERMRFIGGHVDIDSKPGGGTRVTLLVPATALAPRSERVTPPANPDS